VPICRERPPRLRSESALPERHWNSFVIGQRPCGGIPVTPLPQRDCPAIVYRIHDCGPQQKVQAREGEEGRTFRLHRLLLPAIADAQRGAVLPHIALTGDDRCDVYGCVASDWWLSIAGPAICATPDRPTRTSRTTKVLSGWPLASQNSPRTSTKLSVLSHLTRLR
jgi:hypothetical protein